MRFRSTPKISRVLSWSMGCILSVIVAASADVPDARAQLSKPLEAQIEIDEALSAIPSNLLPGNIFKESTDKVDNSNWYPIPEWFAGQWRSDAEQSITKTNLLTNRSTQHKQRMEYPKFVYFGCVRDRNGGLWERAPINRWRLNQYEGQNPIYSLFTAAEAKQPDKQHIVIKSTGFNLVVDRTSKKIQKSLQEECVQVYTTQSPTLMTVKTVGRSYDETGKAYQERVADYEMERVRDIDLDSLKLRYLRRDFGDYARSHNLSELAPDY